MTTVVELEKVDAPVIRKKFCTKEVYKMMEVGILPEESGWELINGEIIHRMTIGSKHASIIKKLNRKLSLLIGERALISIQDPIHINEHNEPEPDIALIQPREDFYAKSHPRPQDVLLLFEISDSTLKYDREIKKILYAEAEIVEFWLVNLIEQTIECYSSPKNGNYRLVKIVGTGETAESVSVENLSLQVDEILGL